MSVAGAVETLHPRPCKKRSRRSGDFGHPARATCSTRPSSFVCATPARACTLMLAPTILARSNALDALGLPCCPRPAVPCLALASEIAAVRLHACFKPELTFGPNRIARLIEADHKGRVYKHLYDVRCGLVHGRKMDVIPGDSRLRARQLARQVVKALVETALDPSCPQRRGFRRNFQFNSTRRAADMQ